MEGYNMANLYMCGSVKADGVLQRANVTELLTETFLT